MKIKVGVIQGVYSGLRYEVRCIENGRETIGYIDKTPDFTYEFLSRHMGGIEGAEFWANASPVPQAAVDAIAKMKEIVGEERCL